MMRTTAVKDRLDLSVQGNMAVYFMLQTFTAVLMNFLRLFIL